MKRGRAVLLLLTLLAPTGALAQSADVDAQRAAWAYRRPVTVPAEASSARSGFAAVVIPPEVGARTQPELQDVRLVEADGREVPYVVDRAVERAATNRWSGQLVDTRREAKSHTVWVVDLGESRTFDVVLLDIRRSDFAKRLRIETSADAREWRVLREDAGIFDRPWTPRVHHTTITLGSPSSTRYLRLTTDDRRSAPIDLHGIEVTASRQISGAEWRRPFALAPIGSRSGVSRYRLDLPPRFPLEILELVADEPVFSRRAVLVEKREVAGQLQDVRLGEDVLYRVKVDDSGLTGDMLALRVERPRGGELVLEIHDGDSPPLRGLRGSATGVATRLLFPTAPGALTLYYGNDATRAPLYDLESLRGRIVIGATFATGSLGPEAPNPHFQRTAPLPFVASRGSVIPVARWSDVRRFTIDGREDLYALTLSAEDLSRSSAGFADLRIIDEADRQLPYVLEPAASERRPTLNVERQSPPKGARGPAKSRYRLTAPGPSPGTSGSLPLSVLELTFQEDFFSRPVRILAPPPTGGDRERTLFSGTLARGTGTRSAVSDGPITLRFSGASERELLLEIDEGDNAPLTLLSARAVLPVPRVAFKAAPGRYRILLGNRDAEPPRYDIASLRQEVLSYSAVPVEASPPEPNPAFRREAADLVRGLPHAVLLWSVLGGAVLVLLALTVRLLRTPAQGGSEGPRPT